MHCFIDTHFHTHLKRPIFPDIISCSPASVYKTAKRAIQAPCCGLCISLQSEQRSHFRNALTSENVKNAKRHVTLMTKESRLKISALVV